MVAIRGDEGPVIVELKNRLTLALLLQAVDRPRAMRMGRSIRCMFWVMGCLEWVSKRESRGILKKVQEFRSFSKIMVQ